VAGFRLSIKPSAVKEIEAVGLQRDRRRIVDLISRLAENPFPPGARKLSGRSRYRLRSGRYRILYEISDAQREIVVIKVGHRKDVYR
jgi:mRNA interferase RelE/StbE